MTMWRRGWSLRRQAYIALLAIFLLGAVILVVIGFQIQRRNATLSLHQDGTLLRTGVNTRCGDSDCDLVGYTVDGRHYAKVLDLIGIQNRSVGAPVPLMIDPHRPTRVDYRGNTPWNAWGAAIIITVFGGVVVLVTDRMVGDSMRRRGVIGGSDEQVVDPDR